MLALKLYTKLHDIGTNRELPSANVSKDDIFIKSIENELKDFNGCFKDVKDMIKVGAKKDLDKHITKLQALLNIILIVTEKIQKEYATEYALEIKLVSLKKVYFKSIRKNLNKIMNECNETCETYFKPHQIHQLLILVIFDYEELLKELKELKKQKTSPLK